MGSTGPADLFVGRVEELRQLEAARAAAAQGHGGLLVVAGDAGVGKTRLVTEFAARATAAGSRVLWGRCREIPGSPPY
ncbi:ATP-binding protein, partial [uncultured Georgenia sp.]|uniref:AAA family ATPase n=1 Tax=uncultured Georgenia sp. TaxID=378209 RepID=UPI002610E2A8